MPLKPGLDGAILCGALATGAENFGQPKVGNVGLPLLPQQDVRGFQITMDDPVRVQVLHRPGNGQETGGSGFQIERPVAQVVGQRVAVDVVHREVVLAVDLPDFVNRNEPDGVGMARARVSKPLMVVLSGFVMGILVLIRRIRMGKGSGFGFLEGVDEVFTAREGSPAYGHDRRSRRKKRYKYRRRSQNELLRL